MKKESGDTKKEGKKTIGGVWKFLIAIVLLVGSYFLGKQVGNDNTSQLLFWVVVGGWAVAIVGAIIDNKKPVLAPLHKQQDKLDDICSAYNDRIEKLEEIYDEEQKKLTDTLITEDLTPKEKKTKTETLRKEYSKQYTKLKEEYKKETRPYCKLSEDAAPAIGILSKWRKCFRSLFPIAAMAYLFSLGGDVQKAEMAQALLDATDTEAWTAYNIPMAHLEDSMRYVSNPDTVITLQTERELNVLLRQFDKALDIESAVIVVNHVADQDIFKFAQEVGNKYGVGRKDRGLVMVLAYRDKLFRIHTGRSLEADLTDVECSRLEADYFVPYMKANQPDSAMLSITNAVKSFFEKKEMPPVSTFIETKEDNSFEKNGISYLIFLVLFGISYLFIGNKLKWSAVNGLQAPGLMGNPFVRQASSDSSSSSSSSSSSYDSSSSSSGGSYGGGSFGGGGATTSW